jgi:hypothetical protein
MSLCGETTRDDRRYLLELVAMNAADPFSSSAQAYLLDQLESALDVSDGSEAPLVRKARLRDLLTKVANKWRMKPSIYPVAKSDSDGCRDVTPGLPLQRVQFGSPQRNVTPRG